MVAISICKPDRSGTGTCLIVQSTRRATNATKMRAHRLVLLVIVFVDNIMLDVAALGLSSLPHPNAPVSIVANSTKLDAVAGDSHGHAEQMDQERGLAEAIKKWWARARGLGVSHAKYLPINNADSKKNLRNLEYEDWLQNSALRPAWNDRDIAEMFEAFRERRIHQSREGSVYKDLPDFFHWLRYKRRMQLVADQCQLMLFKDGRTSELVTRVWLRHHMHPEEVLKIIGLWGGGANAYLRYILQYRTLMEVPVFTDEEALTALLQISKYNVGLTCGPILESMRYEPLLQLAESMQKLFFDRLIAKRVSPAAYSKTIGMFGKAIIHSPDFSVEFGAFKRFTLHYAEADGMRAEAEAAFDKADKSGLMPFLKKMDEGVVVDDQPLDIQMICWMKTTCI